MKKMCDHYFIKRNILCFQDKISIYRLFNHCHEANVSKTFFLFVINVDVSVLVFKIRVGVNVSYHNTCGRR